MEDLVAWVLINVGLGVAPIAATYVAVPTGQRSFRRVCGDGILYFYTAVLMVGLAVDCAKDQRIPPDKIPPGFAEVVYYSAIAACIGMLLLYVLALQDRNHTPAKDGTTHARVSLLLAAIALTFSFYVRGTYQLW